MINISYDVKVFKLGKALRKDGKWSHSVRWSVDGRQRRETFRTLAHAESFRSSLLTACRQGEPFDLDTGRPSAWSRGETDQNWYDFACEYCDMKWPDSAATSRRSRAEGLMTITVALMDSSRVPNPDKEVRLALKQYAFNTPQRDRVESSEIGRILDRVREASPRVSALGEPGVLRPLLSAMGETLAGKPASAAYANRRRMTLSNAIMYAIEKGILAANPLRQMQSLRPVHKSSGQIDRRSVINPGQARSLLAAVGKIKHSGPRLVAFFGLLYYAALRPEEAVCLEKSSLDLPESGWGTLHLGGASPDAGAIWTDSGNTRDQRGLKHRAVNDVRPVPCAPELTAILQHHLSEFGTDPDGRLFWGVRGGAIDSSTYERVWSRARAVVFKEAAATSQLARRPYDLRHAAVSTWLSAGIDPAQVAEWAGHSIAVLLRVYASCIDGSGQLARQRIEAALRGSIGDVA